MTQEPDTPFTPEQLEEIRDIANEISQAKMPRYLRAERVSSETPVVGQSLIWDTDRLKWVPGNATLSANHGPSQHTGFSPWKVIYTDSAGVQKELSLGADGLPLVSTGGNSAPSFRTVSSTNAHENPDPDIHHSRIHGHADSSVDHSNLTGVTEDQHHNKLHDHDATGYISFGDLQSHSFEPT